MVSAEYDTSLSAYFGRKWNFNFRFTSYNFIYNVVCTFNCFGGFTSNLIRLQSEDTDGESQ